MTRAPIPLVFLAVTACSVGATYVPPLPIVDPAPSRAIPRPPPILRVDDGPFPAITGGTMTTTPDGDLVVVDPQAGLLARVDPETRAITASMALTVADEAGRVIADPSGRVHVILRGTGELLTLRESLSVLARRVVCAAPRGLAHDPRGDLVHVACASGELVTLPAAGGEPTRVVTIEPDLRDVLLDGETLYVSVFRTAELLTLDADGAVVARRRPPTIERFGMRVEGPITMAPGVAWRIRALGDGRIAMVHQRAPVTPLNVEPDAGGYSGGECGTGVVEPALHVFAAAGGEGTGGTLGLTTLAVDLATTAGADPTLVVVDGANALHGSFGISSVHRVPASATLPGTSEGSCLFFMEGEGDGLRPQTSSRVAVEALADGVLAVQESGSASLVSFFRDGLLVGQTAHPTPFAHGRGFAVFHTTTRSGVACASCHPEGGEDGHTWDFMGVGPRRTQTLLGGLMETAPFHWSGDQPTMMDIMGASFRDRMGGGLDPLDVTAISEWLDAQRIDEGPLRNAEAGARGAALFATGCANCHAGDKLTNDATLDVGTGGAFQVPSLRGVSYRAPYFHDGCAGTLEEVLAGACGTADAHGGIGALSAEAQADLLQHVRSL